MKTSDHYTTVLIKGTHTRTEHCF